MKKQVKRALVLTLSLVLLVQTFGVLTTSAEVKDGKTLFVSSFNDYTANGNPAGFINSIRPVNNPDDGTATKSFLKPRKLPDGDTYVVEDRWMGYPETFAEAFNGDNWADEGADSNKRGAFHVVPFDEVIPLSATGQIYVTFDFCIEAPTQGSSPIVQPVMFNALPETETYTMNYYHSNNTIHDGDITYTGTGSDLTKFYPTAPYNTTVGKSSMIAIGRLEKNSIQVNDGSSPSVMWYGDNVTTSTNEATWYKAEYRINMQEKKYDEATGVYTIPMWCSYINSQTGGNAGNNYANGLKIHENAVGFKGFGFYYSNNGDGDTSNFKFDNLYIGKTDAWDDPVVQLLPAETDMSDRKISVAYTRTVCAPSNTDRHVFTKDNFIVKDANGNAITDYVITGSDYGNRNHLKTTFDFTNSAADVEKGVTITPAGTLVAEFARSAWVAGEVKSDTDGIDVVSHKFVASADGGYNWEDATDGTIETGKLYQSQLIYSRNTTKPFKFMHIVAAYEVEGGVERLVSVENADSITVTAETGVNKASIVNIGAAPNRIYKSFVWDAEGLAPFVTSIELNRQ